MDCWSQILIEWVNCLNLTEEPVCEIQQLSDAVFYSKLLGLLNSSSENSLKDEDQIREFLLKEYPKFQWNEDDETDSAGLKHVYLTTLMLLSTSHQPKFHPPMYNLKNETQILIKKFLEKILPHGKNITMDTIRGLILEVTEGATKTPPKTPKGFLPLKTFLNSPAAQSSYHHKMMNEQNLEIRNLRAQLETEQFEKTDLIEDIRVLEEKVSNLQKKLTEKNEQLKTIKAERNYFSTPQSTKKNKHGKGGMDEILRKEIDHLESFNCKLQQDLDKFQEDNENLNRQLMTKERLNDVLQKKLNEFINDKEALETQLETRMKELLDLKMENEDMRNHIKKMQKCTLDIEQSFEIDRTLSPTPLLESSNLNLSECASSIIEIQLREVTEEAKKWKSQVESLQSKLNLISQECEEFKNANELLNEKMSMLDQVKLSLEITEDKLEKSYCRSNILEMEKNTLASEIEKLVNEKINKTDPLIEELKLNISKLETEVSSNKNELNNIKVILTTTEDDLEQTKATNEVLQMTLSSLKVKLTSLEAELSLERSKYNELSQSSDEKLQNLESKIEEYKKEMLIYEETISKQRKEMEESVNNHKITISNVESTLSELTELQEELQSQLDQEKNNNKIYMNEKQNYERKISTLEHTKIGLKDEILLLRNEYEKLLKIVEDWERNCLKLKETNEILESSNEKLSSQLNEVTAEVKELKSVHEHVQSQLKQEEEGCKKLMAEKTQLKNIILSKDSEINNLLQKISQNELEQNDKCHQNSELQESLDKVSKELAQTSKNVEMLQVIIAQNETTINQLNDNSELFMAEKKTLTEELKKVLEEKRHLEENLEEKTINLMTKQKEYEELTAKMRLLVEDLSGKDLKLQEITVQRDDLRLKVDDVSIELGKRSTEVEQLLLQVDELTKSKNDLINCHQKQEDIADTTVDSLEKKLIDVQKTCESWKLEAKLNAESLSIHKSKLEELTKERIESELKLKEDILNLEKVKANQMEMILKKTLEVESLESEIKTMKEDLSIENENYKLMIEELKVENQKLVLKGEEKLSEMKELEMCLLKEREELTELKMKVESMETKSLEEKGNVSIYSEDKANCQLEKLIKEKKDLKDKLDAVRVRSAKMEKNMDDLRNENKKMKIELLELSTLQANSNDKDELERLKTLKEELEMKLISLENDKIELENEKKELIHLKTENDFEERLKEVHNEYGLKLEKIKQKMKTAYNEQVSKLNAEQERAMAAKVADLQMKMEKQCKQYTDDIEKYKSHVAQLSSKYWNVGEKLLAEKQEKEEALNHLQILKKKSQIQQMNEFNQTQQINSCHFDNLNDLPIKTNYRAVQLIEEQTTTTRRHSVKSIQAMGNAFDAEDEEGELFDNNYLADLKEGKCHAVDSGPNLNRLSELQLRNSMCRPHLKSSYAAETHYHPYTLTEEEIKSGQTNDDTFNDSLSQSLLPGQKKKKDRTQTSYKKPGPPTPSKNGGRLSLQGNEIKSPMSRILRERNSERRTTATTPKRLKDFFSNSLSRKTDENVSTPTKGRRLSSIFRKPRTTDRV